MEKSLVLVKPDAVPRGITGEIIRRLEGKGLKPVALRMLHMDKALAQRHYAVHKDKPFFKDLVEYITSGPIVAMVFSGNNATHARFLCSFDLALGFVRPNILGRSLPFVNPVCTRLYSLRHILTI